MLQSGFRKIVAAMAGAAVIGTIPSLASASPPSGVTIENFATADLDTDAQANNDRVKFQTKDPTDIRVQRLTFAAGGTTGWHHHPGLVMVVVQSGTINLWETDCSQKTYGPGAPDGAVFIEALPHAHQATSQNGATVYVTYVVPSASPPVFRVEEQVPFCATSL